LCERRRFTSIGERIKRQKDFGYFEIAPGNQPLASHLVKSLALEGAEHGIRASAVCPGYVRTPLVEQQIVDQANAHGIPEDRVLEDVILAPQALKRLLEPSEVADAVAYLLGPGGALFTGAPLVMDGGWTAR
jgi:3-hydroxybutyrate dehydrogenase